MKKFAKNILKILPLLLCIILAAVYIFSGREISVDAILDYAPENSLYAALFIILLYALKSLSVIFPIVILEIAAGFLFPPVAAVVVSLVGIAAGFSISYIAGRLAGADYAERLLIKYPKLRDFISPDEKSQFRLSFILRAISFLPADVVSMYLGAVKIPFWKYISGSILGTLPSLITVSVMGGSITEPGSPAFIISTELTVVFSLISCTGYIIRRNRKSKKEKL